MARFGEGSDESDRAQAGKQGRAVQMEQGKEGRDPGDRRRVLGVLIGSVVCVAWGRAAQAQGLGGALTGLLGAASDHALEKLAQPGAFYGDTSVRIGLPGLGGGGSGGGGLLGGLGSALGGIGGFDPIVRKLNDAGGMAARAAKPVFRAAISRLSFTDVPALIGQNDGATRYLRKSAGPELHAQVRPLVDSALGALGVYREIDRVAAGSSALAALGLNHDKLGNSVTEQALGGIFKYMGVEEANLRAHPLGATGLGSALEGLKLP